MPGRNGIVTGSSIPWLVTEERENRTHPQRKYRAYVSTSDALTTTLYPRDLKKRLGTPYLLFSPNVPFLLYTKQALAHNPLQSIVYEVKFLVKFTTTSFSLPSSSLLSAPSLSIDSIKLCSLLLRCCRKSASHDTILSTGTLSK